MPVFRQNRPYSRMSKQFNNRWDGKIFQYVEQISTFFILISARLKVFSSLDGLGVYIFHLDSNHFSSSQTEESSGCQISRRTITKK